jgi:5-keto 4-deoxyuronate isomerase
MKLGIRYAEHPGDVKNYDARTLRDRFLRETVFAGAEEFQDGYADGTC